MASATQTDAATKVTVTKAATCGHATCNGHEFDSGCNLSGVTEVHIKCDEHYEDSSHRYRSVIQRVYLSFNQNHTGKAAMYCVLGSDVYSTGSKSAIKFVVLPNDPIVKVVVWVDSVAINAMQFHTASGNTSPLFGIKVPESEMKVIKGPSSASKLVGVYGTFDQIIRTLGFTFATKSAPATGSSKRRRVTTKPQNDE